MENEKLGTSIRRTGWGNSSQAHLLTKEFIDEARERYALMTLEPMPPEPRFPRIHKWLRRIKKASDALRGYHDWD